MRQKLTLIFPYYDNPGMLLQQLQNLRSWPEELRAHWSLIVVDDCSPSSPAAPVFEEWSAKYKRPLPTSLYRIKVDVRWNWIACRNLAVHQCATEFFLMTDIDHLVPAETAEALSTTYHNPVTAFRFSRVSAPDMSPYKPHPNSWFMSKTLFDKVGGYDERFSGGYGTDKEFWNRVELHSRRVVMLDEHLIRVGREVVPDASTTRYERKTREDAERKAKVKAAIALDPVPKRLTFPWEQVF